LDILIRLSSIFASSSMQLKKYEIPWYFLSITHLLLWHLQWSCEVLQFESRIASIIGDKRTDLEIFSNRNETRHHDYHSTSLSTSSWRTFYILLIFLAFETLCRQAETDTCTVNEVRNTQDSSKDQRFSSPSHIPQSLEQSFLHGSG